MINEVFDLLKISDYSIKINNRKILKGIADSIGAEDQLNELCVAIDKLDKIGEEKVLEELRSRSISDNSINEFKAFLKIKGGFESKLIETQRLISESEAGLQGISEMKQIIGFLQDMELENHHLVFDPLLARGLSYYTGTILEVKVNNVNIGSVSGGGRYDDLTGIFGMPSVSGVGISFGVDRIYDVLETLDLFPPESSITSTVLIIPFVEKSLPHGLKALSQLRAAGVKSEIYPDLAKLKKQMSYADKKNIPFVVLLGEEEITNDFFTLKDMVSGEQSKYNLSDLIEFLSSK